MSDVMRLLEVPVSRVDLARATEELVALVASRESGYVVVANVHVLIEAKERAEMREALEGAAMVVPDGMPLVWLAHRYGYRDVGRVVGVDLMWSLSRRLAERGGRVFFYGGAEGVAEQAAQVMLDAIPGLELAGCYSPPFRELSEEEDEAVMRMLQEAKPDVVWVGLGAPKQELWMARMCERVGIPVMVGVGAAFNYLTGDIQRAPEWMQRYSLEWAYRLWQEPGRLWKRYLVTNGKFLFYCVRDFLLKIT